jgi:hypothetical protein
MRATLTVIMIHHNPLHRAKALFPPVGAGLIPASLASPQSSASPAPLDSINRINYLCLDWCTFLGDRVGPIGTVFFTYVFILISNSIPTFEKNRAKSALVSDLPKTSNKNIKPFFHPSIEFYFSLKNKIIQFEILFISLRLGVQQTPVAKARRNRTVASARQRGQGGVTDRLRQGAAGEGQLGALAAREWGPTAENWYRPAKKKKKKVC